MDSVASRAPTSPPVTGASRAVTPFSAATVAIFAASVGLEVVMSQSRPPDFMPESAPASPTVTASTSAG